MSASIVTHLRPAMQWTAADDPYTVWFNAQQRSGEALGAWRDASRDDRVEAFSAYVFELELEEMAAAELQRQSFQQLVA
jgi:hypothetical protein